MPLFGLTLLRPSPAAHRSCLSKKNVPYSFSYPLTTVFILPRILFFPGQSVFVQKHFTSESFPACAVLLQTHGHTLLPPRTLLSPSALADTPCLCSPLVRCTHPSSPPLQPCSPYGRKQRGQLGRQVSKSKSGSSLGAVAPIPLCIPLFLLCYASHNFFCSFPPPEPSICALPSSSPFSLSLLCLPPICP